MTQLELPLTSYGPLAILKRTCANEIDVPDMVREAPAEYMWQLGDNLSIAAETAEAVSQKRQSSYAGYYNRATKEKLFVEGQQVLVHDADPPNKMHPRWNGPHTVLAPERQHSYDIEDADGKRCSVHANKLRAYNARVGQVGVVFEGDEAFGEISCTLSISGNIHEIAEITHQKLDHLTPSRRTEITALSHEYRDLFRTQTKIAKLGEHRIELKEGQTPRRPQRYRIPETLKGEVTRQVNVLLAQGLVYPVESEHAHPIICVAKKDGGIRMCVDYRALNEPRWRWHVPDGAATEINP